MRNVWGFRGRLYAVVAAATVAFGGLGCTETGTGPTDKQSGPFTVTSPAKGGSYPIGDTLKITWTADSSYIVYFDIRLGGQRIPILPEAVQSDGGVLEWLIPGEMSWLTAAIPTVTDSAYLVIEEYDSRFEPIEVGPFAIREPLQ